MDGKTATMPDTSIAADFNKAFHVEVDFPPKPTFYRVLLVNNLANTANLLLAEVLYLNVRIDTTGRQNLMA